MVVFRSPVQRRHRTGGFSTSPAPSTAMDEDPDNIFNATPGPSRARSVDVASIGGSSSHVKGVSGQNGVPASALLQQRLAQSLMMVAESPSSKLNAPDPFKPRNQLRRSPPVAMKALDHHLGDSNKQDRMTEMTVETEAEVVLEVPATTMSSQEPRLPSSKGKERERSFDVAAKALFDSNKADRTHQIVRGGRASMPPTSLSEALLTPRASKHRRLPSLQEQEIHRSAPIYSTKSNASSLLAPPGVSVLASPGSPGKNATPVKSLATIGRLTARNAHLETKLKSVSSEFESILQAHQQLQEQCEYIKQEKEAALERVQKFELIANECEELIESHERLQLANVDLQEQRQADIVELETIKEAMGKLKWRERKLRYELGIRREEGIYREFELQNDQLNPVIRQLKLDKSRLQVSVADLRESVSTMKYDKKAQDRSLQAAQEELEWYRGITATHQEDLASLQKRLEKRNRAIAELEDEQRQLLERLTEETEEKERLAEQLEAAQVKIANAAKETAEGRESYRELIGSQTAVRRLEKETEKLQAQLADRNSKLNKQVQNLQSQLDDKTTKLDQAVVLHQNLFQRSEEQLKQSQTDLRALEKRFKALEKERDQLKSTWDMHRRASRVFGDAPNQTDAEAAAGSSLPPFIEREDDHATGRSTLAGSATSGKRKRDKDRVDAENSKEEEEEDTDDGAKPAARMKNKKASKSASSTETSRKASKKQRPVSDEDEEEDARPVKRKKQQSKEKRAKPTALGGDGTDSDTGSELAPPPNKSQMKKGRRRTAIKSGVPEQFREQLKEEADKSRNQKKNKRRKQTQDTSGSEQEEDSSEPESESDTVEVASSPKRAAISSKSSKTSKTPVHSSQIEKAASGKLKKAMKEDDEISVKSEKKANTSAKSGTSASASSGGTLPAKKKIALHKGTSSTFSWGAGNLGGSQMGKLFDLPDVLSPVIKR